MRAVRNRNANGKYRQISKAMTVTRATGTLHLEAEQRHRGADRCDRNATGSSQPSTDVPIAFTMPNWGFSIVCHTNVTATTGATYGRSIDARTNVRPGSHAAAPAPPPGPTPIEADRAHHREQQGGAQRRPEPGRG